MRLPFFFTAILTVLVSPCWSEEKAEKLSAEELIGTWKLIRAEMDGKKSQLSITKLVFTKDGEIEIHESTPTRNTADIDRFKVRQRGELKELDQGTTTENGDLVLSENKLGNLSYAPCRRGIYKIKNNTLTICWQRDEEKPRPTSFTTKAGDGTTLLVLERVAPVKE